MGDITVVFTQHAQWPPRCIVWAINRHVQLTTHWQTSNDSDDDDDDDDDDKLCHVCHVRSSGGLSSPLSCRYFAISFGNTLLNSMISNVLNFYNKTLQLITGFVADIKTLFSRTFQDLQRPNSRVFQDSKTHF